MQAISLRLQGLKDGCLSESLPRGAFARLKGKERKAMAQVCGRSRHNNSHTVASSRTHWKTSFSIISSNAQQQQTVSKEVPMEEEEEEDADDAILLPSPVNGKPCALQSGILDQDEGKDNMKIMAKQKKPLTLIEDLLPPPAHGSQIRVAYQGVSGAYSESAANKAYPGCDAVPCEEFEGAFKAVELWIADRAVMPVENSLGGSIHRNYDLLLRHRLHIVGEVQLPVNHCLLAMPGVRKDQLKRIISHPQALSQCENTLTSMLGTMGSAVSREAFYDTAGAAEYVAMKGLRDTAAIASMKAAETYGLSVLGEGIQDDPSNVTRFVMLARDPIIPRTDRPFKTSIVFANEEEANGNGTSCLFKVLSAFAFRNISLTKIESRPHRNKPLRVVDDEVNTLEQGQARHFEYMFYVDFEASMADSRSQNALSDVLEFTSFLRVLGSYPMDMTPLSFSNPPK